MQGRTTAVPAPEVLLRHMIDARQDFLRLHRAGEEDCNVLGIF
jgi:hypothetical protein